MQRLSIAEGGPIVKRAKRQPRRWQLVPMEYRRKNIAKLKKIRNYKQRVYACFWAFLFGAISKDDWDEIFPKKVKPIR